MDAIKVFARLGAAKAIPIHWGTFRLSFEAYDTPPKMLDALMRCTGGDPAQFAPATIGQPIDIAPYARQTDPTNAASRHAWPRRGPAPAVAAKGGGTASALATKGGVWWKADWRLSGPHSEKHDIERARQMHQIFASTDTQNSCRSLADAKPVSFASPMDDIECDYSNFP